MSRVSVKQLRLKALEDALNLKDAEFFKFMTCNEKVLREIANDSRDRNIGFINNLTDINYENFDNIVVSIYKRILNLGTSKSIEDIKVINIDFLVSSLLPLNGINSTVIEPFKKELETKHLKLMNTFSIHDFLMKLQEEILELSTLCIPLVHEHHHTLSSSSSTTSTTHKKKLKAVSLSNSTTTTTKSKKVDISLKSKQLNDKILETIQKQASININDIHQCIILYSLQILKIHTFLTVFPKEHLYYWLCSSDRKGWNHEGKSLISYIKLLYEEILPAILLLLKDYIHAHKEGSSSSDSDESGDKKNMIQQITQLLIVIPQRNVKSFQVLLQLAQSSLLSSSTPHHSVTSSTTAELIWIEMIRYGIEPDNESNEIFGVFWNEDIAMDLHPHHGALLSDVSKVYSHDLRTYIEWACNQEPDLYEGQSEYFFSMCESYDGLYTRATTATKKKPSTTTIKATIPSKPLSSASSSSSIASLNTKNDTTNTTTTTKMKKTNKEVKIDTNMIDSVKSIFPDYGDLFITACLHVFDGNIERTLDALLSDNLPPQLQTIDRTIKKAWQGKGTSNGSSAMAMGKQGRSEEVVYNLNEDTQVKSTIKEQLRLERQHHERDMLLMAREYDDDYDDQFDEAIIYQPSMTNTMNNIDNNNNNSNKSSSIQSKSFTTTETNSNIKTSKSNQGNGIKVDWDVRMKEMKRLNEMTREDESELNYWNTMKNTNKIKSSNKKSWEDNDDEEEDDDRDGEERYDNKMILDSRNKKPSSSSSSGGGRGGMMSTSQFQSQSQTSGKLFGRGATTTTTAATGTSGGGSQHIKSNPFKADTTTTTTTGKKNDQSETPSQEGQNQGQKKYRHKTFDRHHQRDKATRKMMSGFSDV